MSVKAYEVTSKQLVALVGVVDATRERNWWAKNRTLMEARENNIDRNCARITPERKAALAAMRADRALAREEGRPPVYK